MGDIFEDLYKIARKLSIMNPYASLSEYYGLRDAAEALSQALPEQDRQKFMDYVYIRIRNLSNYAGD